MLRGFRRTRRLDEFRPFGEMAHAGGDVVDKEMELAMDVVNDALTLPSADMEGRPNKRVTKMIVMR